MADGPSWSRSSGSDGPSWSGGGGLKFPPLPGEGKPTKSQKPQKPHYDWLTRHILEIPHAAETFGAWPFALADKYGPNWAQTPAHVFEALGGSPVAAVAHPANTIKGAAEATRGLVELPFLLPYAYGKEVAKGKGFTHSFQTVEKQFGKSIASEYKRRYGKNWQAELEKNPFSFLSDALLVLGPAARAAALGHAFERLGAAEVARTPKALWEESSRPGILSEGAARTRRIEYTPPGAAEPEFANLPYSTSPFRRGIQQAQDPLSMAHPHLPVVGARARVVRAGARELDRYMQRVIGAVPGASALDKLPEEGRTRLFYGSQIKDHSDEALTQLRDVLQREYTKETPKTGDENFDQMLWEAKQAGFGPRLIDRLDKAIKYQPDKTYWKAEGAMRHATGAIEQVIKDANGFTSLQNDLKRALERHPHLTDPAEIDASNSEIDNLTEQLSTVAERHDLMFASRRNRVREFFDANRFADVPERRDQLQALSEHPNIGPEKAQWLIAKTDAIANATGDPAGFYERAIGSPTGEPAQALLRRGANALLQPGIRRDLVEKTLAGAEAAAEQGGSIYYSEFQRRLSQMNWESMPASELEAIFSKPSNLPPLEYYHAGLDLYFESLPPGYRVTKEEFLNHFSSIMNSYDLMEYHFANDPALRASNLHTEWDAGGELLSREPNVGEYREIVMTFGPNTDGIRNLYDSPFSKGQTHWAMPNVIVHVRFHVFEENGVRKLLVDEVQSDWESDWRARRMKREEFKGQERTPEQQRAINELTDAYTAAKEQIAQLARRQDQAGEAEGWNSETVNSLREEINNLYGGLENVTRELHQLHGPPPPSMFGPVYYRAAIRRAFRAAAEEQVDEIIVSDPRVQHVRNHPDHPVLGDTTLDNLPHDYESDDPFADRPIQHVTDHYARHPDELNGPRERMYSKDIPDFARKAYGVTPEHVDNAYEGYFSSQSGGRSEVGPMPGTRFRLTPEAKATAMKPSALFQHPPDWGALPKGATELFADGNRVIHMFKDADVSTWIHELAHTALFDLPSEDRKILEDHYGGGATVNLWKESAHENYARDFELYSREGVAPNASLQRIFTRVSKWMREIYKQVDETQTEIPDQVRAVFDRMFTRSDEPPDIFIPHRSYKPDLSGLRSSRGIPRANREIGDSAKSRIPLFAKNRLAHLRSGMISDDPRHLFEHLGRGMALAKANQLREAVLEMAQPLDKGKAPDFATQYVVKKAGRGVDKPYYDALESADSPDAIRSSISAYIDDHIGGANKWEEWKNEDQLYVVDKKFVDMLFKQVTGKKPGATTGPKSTVGRLFDTTLDSTRALLLYGNPGFYAANMAGNAWMTAVSDPRAFRYFKWSMKNALAKSSDSRVHRNEVDPFWEQISVEMGRGPTAGQLSTRPGLLGQTGPATSKGGKVLAGAEHVGSGLPQRWGARSGAVIDDSFRVGAWRQAAAKRGYKTKEQQQQLLNDAASESRTDWRRADSKARRDLNSIRDEAENLMLDFDSMTPFEKTYLTRAIFLYPFLRASAKYPFMFAGERPTTAGALGAVGTAGSQMATEEYGPRPDLPPWAEGYARLPGGRYLNIGSVSPYQPLQGMIESALALGQPAPIGINRPLSYLNPVPQILLELARSQNKYGRDAPAWQILQQDFPAPAYLSQLLGLRQPSAQYSDTSERATLLRSLRLVPFGMTAQSGGTGGPPRPLTFPPLPGGGG